MYWKRGIHIPYMYVGAATEDMTPSKLCLLITITIWTRTKMNIGQIWTNDLQRLICIRDKEYKEY